MTVDHVVPVALGGVHSPDNLVACCRDCNAGKSSTSPTEGTVEDVKNVDLKWAEAMKRAADIQASERAECDEYVTRFLIAWPRWTPRNAEGSVASLYKAGLPLDEMLNAVQIADRARGVDDRFAYFCGVAWNKVHRMQEIAKGLLEVDDAEAK